MNISQSPFGKLEDNTPITAFTLSNDHGISIEILNYGGVIRTLKMPDQHGNIEDIVLGFSNIQAYEKSQFYLGGIIGRYANRINKGLFYIGKRPYQLSVNSQSNHLHGGKVGLDKVVWNATPFSSPDKVGLHLQYLSPHLTEGYPGNTEIVALYTLNNDNVFEIILKAISDKDTIINLTNHASFNLSGNVRSNILNHELSINSFKFLHLNKQQIPTGKFYHVRNTPFDFREVKSIGKDINEEDNQLLIGKGYDHCMILNDDAQLKFGALLKEPISGRKLTIYTTKPSLQFYTGNYLAGIVGKHKKVYKKYDCVCLEAQHYPDSPNHSHFPSTLLKAGSTYHSQTLWKFDF